MITDKIYAEQMDRLEAMANYKFYPGAFKSWKRELDNSGYSDERLIKAVDRIAYSLTSGNLKSRDINYGTLNAACQAVRLDNQLQLQPARDIPLTQLVNPNRQGLSPYAKELIVNVKNRLDGLITKDNWIINHKQICQKHKQLIPKYIFGKHWIEDNPPTKSHWIDL